MRILLLLGLCFVGACGARSPSPAGASPPVVASPDAGASGKACASVKDCGAGETCQGPQGCEVGWTCAPDRPCTMDLVAYCTCDGRTVMGSGSCPPEPYKHKGECP